MFFECHRNYQKYIILSYPRSGSNHLSYLLNSHPNIISIGEIFNRAFIEGLPGKPWIQKNRLLKKIRYVSPALYTELFAFNFYKTEIKAVGFKLFYHQALIPRYSPVIPYLQKKKGLKIIHLVRDNALEGLVSYEIALKTNFWSTLSQKKPPQISVYLDPEKCAEHFAKMEIWKNEFINEYFPDKNKLTVKYEMLSANPKKESQRIQKFLGVPLMRLHSPLKKQNKLPLQKAIINYEDLKKIFNKTTWGQYFNS